LDALGRVVHVDQRVFGKNTLSRPAAAAIFIKRPEIYAALFDPDGAVVGYLDVYPLQPIWGERFIDGEICEADFMPNMILERSESHDGCCFYAGSIVVDDRFDPISKSMMIAGLFKWHAHYLAAMVTQQTRLIMTVASARGARLVEKIAASKLRDGRHRKDGLDIFGRPVTPAAIGQMHAAFSKLDIDGVIHLEFLHDSSVV